MAQANYIEIIGYLLTVDDSGSSRIGLELSDGSTHQLQFKRSDLDIYTSKANLLRIYTCYWDPTTKSITTSWIK